MLLALLLIGDFGYYGVDKDSTPALASKCYVQGCKVVAARIDPSKDGWTNRIQENILESEAERIVVVYLPGKIYSGKQNLLTMIDQTRNAMQGRIDYEIGFNYMPNQFLPQNWPDAAMAEPEQDPNTPTEWTEQEARDLRCQNLREYTRRHVDCYWGDISISNDPDIRL